jgi:hypothetical protein
MVREYFAEAVYKKAELRGTEYIEVGCRPAGGHGCIASMRLGESGAEGEMSYITGTCLDLNGGIVMG